MDTGRGEKSIETEKTRDYMRRPCKIEGKIIKKQHQINDLYKSLGVSGIRHDKEKVISSASDQMLDTFARISELESDIKALKKERQACIEDIYSNLDQLPDAKEAIVLAGWFITGKSAGEIAEQIGYSERHTMRIKEKGLFHLTEILEKNKTCH